MFFIVKFMKKFVTIQPFTKKIIRNYKKMSKLS